MFAKRALAAIVTVAMVSLFFTGFAASSNAAPAVTASASSFAVSGPRVVKQGERVVYSASVGRAHQGRLAVLEETTRKGRVAVSVGRVDPKGEVKFTTTLPVSGERKVQVRVLKGRQTVAMSDNFTVNVNERALTAAQKTEQAREAEIAAMAVGTRVGAAAYTPGKISGAKATRAKMSTVSATVDLSDAFSDAGSTTRVTAEHTAEKTSKMVESQSEDTFNKEGDNWLPFGDTIKGSIINFGIKELFKLIFPTTNSTINAINQLAAQMASDFQVVDAQLAAIEGDLNTLQQQVKTVSSQVTSANASSSAANCSVLMSQADGFVSQIQAEFNNYQDTLNPTWVTSNINNGSNPDSVMLVLGNQVFGSGAGNPSFLQGANSSQQATTSLAHLLTGFQLPPGNSLIKACASAVSARLADEASGLNNSSVTFVTPAGNVDSSYFDNMQAITAYYSSWANIGQFLSTLGSQWAILSLDPTPPISAASASATCAGVVPSGSPSPRAALTCQQLGANINDTKSAVAAAWNQTGASWGQVSNNMLGADTRVASNSDYMIPAQSVWALDPSKMTNGQGQSYAQTNVFPFGTGGAPFAGINLPPANSNQWNNLLQLINQPPAQNQNGTAQAVCGGRTPSAPGTIVYRCTAQATMGQLISAAGLSFGGTIGGKLIFTGEQPNYWNPTKGPARYAFSASTNPLVCNGGGDLSKTCTPVNQTIQSWATGNANGNMGFYVNPFIDPALTGNNNFSVVVNDPAGVANNFANALDMNDLYAWSNGTSLAVGYNGWGQYPQQSTSTATNISGNSFMYGPCQSTGSDNNATNLNWDTNQSGGSRLWAQWTLPLGYSAYGNSWTVSTNSNCGFAVQPASLIGVANNGWMNQGSVSYGANFNVQVTNTEGVYGWVPILPHSYMTNVPSQVAGIPMTGTMNNTNGYYSGTGTYTNPAVAAGPVTGGALSIQAPNGPATSGGPTNVGVTVPTGSPIFAASSTTNSLNTATTTGLVWPAMSLASNTCPTAGGLAGMTTFSQGGDGNAGVTNTCEYLWAAYEAAMLNQDTGNLEVLFPDQSTGFAGGNQAVVSVTNSGSTTTTATLYLGGGRGLTNLPGTASIVNGSTGAVTSCAEGSLEGVSDTQCTITVPPGTSAFTLPIQYNPAATSGELTVMVSDWGGAGVGANSVAGSTATLLNQTVPTGDVPGSPVNLAVTASSSAANSVSATWTAPNADPAITSYTVTITDPNGSVTTQTINPNSLTVAGSSGGQAANSLPGVNNSDMQVTTTFTLPSNKSGQWTFSLTATNANGTSAPANVTTFLGDGPPPQIVGLSASENSNGTVTVSWNPVTASPAVSGYLITWQGSDGKVSATQTVGVPQFTLPNASSAATSVTLTPGVWTFQVQAQNSQGVSSVSSTQVNVIGSAPKAVNNLVVGISADGVISAQWNGADAVPAPTSYNLAIYGPDAAGTAILTQDFPVKGVKSQVNIPLVYQIGNNAKVGMYTVVVTGTNAVGIGNTAASDLFISQATINRSTINQVGQLINGSLPASFQALAAAQCQAGLWQSGYSVFGSCNTTTNVFTSAPGLPPFYLPPSSATTPTAVTGASPWSPTGRYVVGDLVTYGGGTYRCIQGYQGNGDVNWILALSLWTRVA